MSTTKGHRFDKFGRIPPAGNPAGVEVGNPLRGAKPGVVDLSSPNVTMGQYNAAAEKAKAGFTNADRMSGVRQPMTSSDRLQQLENVHADNRVNSPAGQAAIGKSKFPDFKTTQERIPKAEDKDKAATGVGLEGSIGFNGWYRQ